MLSKIINWGIFIAIVYGLYSYFSTGDITFAPPTKQQVQKLALAHSKTLKLAGKERVVAGDKCTRNGGGWIKQTVYACPVNVFAENSMYTKPVRSHTFQISKKNSQWYIIQ